MTKKLLLVKLLENVAACKKTGASPALCQPSRDESREDRSAFALKKDKRNTKETKKLEENQNNLGRNPKMAHLQNCVSYPSR